MDILLALGLLHVVAGLVWTAGVAILALILLVARGDDGAMLRALSETAHLSRRVLRPAILATVLSGVALAARAGELGEASVVLSTVLAALVLVTGAAMVVPACEAAREMPRAAALVRGRQALGLAGLNLGAQGAAIALLVLAPGWGGAAVLGGLVACLALAAALVGEGEPADPFAA